MLFFSLFSIVCGLVLLGVGCGSDSNGFLAGLFLFLVLITLGGVLFVFYLRAIGRLNLPCWPSRAARITRTLIPSEDPAFFSADVVGPKRSSTEMTLVVENSAPAAQLHAERSKLIEESDTAEAEKIGDSRPKIVLKMESEKMP